MSSPYMELTNHSAVQEVVGVKQDEAAAFAVQLLASQAVPWETFVSAGVLADRDVQLIRRFDKRDKFTQAALWEKEGTAYATVFFNVLRNVSKDDTTQYVLALLEEALVVDKERVRLFHGAHMGNPTPYVVILRLLERTDWFIQDRASRLLCRLVSSRPDRGRPLGVAGTASPAETASAGAAPAAPSTPPPPGSAGAACLSFLDWAVRTLRSPGDPRCVAPATAALACLMCERELRPVAFRHGALGLLAPTLRSAAAGPHNVQLLYDAGLAVWLLTFYAPAAEGTVASGALAGLIETARGASKEKVVRVALQALRNLLDCQEAPGARAAVQAASGRLAATLRLRAFHDDDLNAALDFLEGAGAGGGGAANHAGSWERYRQEVLSGALDWGGPRGDESFWRDHVPLLEEGNHALVKQLCTVLQAPSTPPRALAVACHDLGHIATAVPRGRAVIAETGAKATLLKLMTHEDEDVRKQALLATQKLLVVGWQYLPGANA